MIGYSYPLLLKKNHCWFTFSSIGKLQPLPHNFVVQPNEVISHMNTNKTTETHALGVPYQNIFLHR